MSRPGREDLVMVGILVLAFVLFFWDAILLRGAFFVQDVMVQNYPFRDFYSQALKQWQLPLWHPGINCGFPLFAEGQAGVLYPFNLLTAFLLPTFAGITANVVFHMWLGAAGTYWYLRILSCAPAAALAGGLTYGFSGFLVVRAMSQNYIDVSGWMPFLFVLLELAFRTRQLSYLWGVSAVVGLQFLAGHPQATAYAVGAAALYGVFRALGQGARKRVIAAVVIMPLLGAALAAVQLLPTLELVQLSGRSGGLDFEEVAKMSLPPERLVTFLLPNAFGNPSTGSYWGQGAGFFIQLCPYVGVLPLLLALIALRERRDGVTAFFLALCGAAVILALGSHTELARLLYTLPGWSFFRIPTRFLAWVCFGGAVLAGLGMDMILSGGGGQRGRRWTAIALAVPVATMAILNRHVLLAAVDDRAWASTHLTQLWQYRADLWSDLIRCTVMLVVGYALLSPRCVGWRKRAVVWLVPILIFADLYSFGAGFNSLIPVSTYRDVPDAALFIHSDIDSTWGDVRSRGSAVPAVGIARSAALVSELNSPYDWHSNWARDLSSYEKYPGTLRMYTGSLYGLANTLPGWSPLHLRRQWQFTSGHPQFLDLANVGYLISYNPLALSGLELVHEGDVRIYRNHRALPRAYVVPRSVTRSGGDVLGYMKSRAFDPRSEVVVEEIGVGESASEGSGRFSAATIATYEPERVEIELGDHEGGMLVLADSHYPGWRAWVDGIEAPVLRANYVFRSVPVEPDARRVSFEYRSSSFTTGAWVSLVAVITLVAGLAASHYGGPMQVESSGISQFSARPIVLQIMLIIIIHGALRSWPQWSVLVARCTASSVWPL